MTYFVPLDYSFFTQYKGEMDVHPIPQNVTSFQFKLVGDMTLKQFGYLAAGVGTAYLLFVFLTKDYPLIAWPLIAVFVLMGLAFAFLPIESRPLDYWLIAFLKAVYTPTKRVWRKNGKTFKDEPLFQSRMVMFMSGVQPTPSFYPQAPLVVFPAPGQTPPPTPNPPPAPLPTPEELKKTVDLARQAQSLQMKIIQNERTLAHIKESAAQPTSVPVDYTQEVNKILTDLQNLMSQASVIKQQLQKVEDDREPKPAIPLAPVISPRIMKEKIKVVMPLRQKQTTIALTTFPNVINGIVKDNQNNYLEGVVAVIYDKEGLPVRALKTNKLGQFTGSTPLPNGTYTLELEKDTFTFDVLQIELTGGVLPPLLITAK